MFPIPKNSAPPQLVISQVCSCWRRVALRTPELWCDTRPKIMRYSTNHIYLHQRWVFRATALPITLSIDLDEPSLSIQLAGVLRDILLPIQVKRLSLRLTYEQLMALSTIPEAALSGLSEFEVELTFPNYNMNINTSDPHPLITRLRSVTFRGNEAGPWIDRLRPSLPWSQLQSLNFEHYMDGLGDIAIGILRQIPTLEVLSLWISEIGTWEQLTMLSLRNLTTKLTLLVVNGTEVDNVLRSFMCPSLTQFTVLIRDGWTCETFHILKRQYNMQELREAKSLGAFALPVSFFLRDAPMLHSLSLGESAITDDEALIGISTGILGRFLRGLEINIPYDIGEVLDMVEARKRTVDGLIENGCSWREEITSLKDVVIHSKHRNAYGEYKERITALGEAGIHIAVSF